MRMFSTWNSVASSGAEAITMSRSCSRIRWTHSIVAAASSAGSTVNVWSYLFLKYRASFARRPASAGATGEDSRLTVETFSNSTAYAIVFAPSRRLQRGRVRAGEPAVDEERRRVHVGGLVGGEEQDGVRNLARLGEATHRDVHHAPLGLHRVGGVELAQERRVDRSRAERVDADAALGELDAELPREGEHAALGGGVGDLRGGGAHDRDERRGVDDRAAAAVEQVRDAVLAAQEDRAQVRGLHPLPRLEGRVDD